MLKRRRTSLEVIEGRQRLCLREVPPHVLSRRLSRPSPAALPSTMARPTRCRRWFVGLDKYTEASRVSHACGVAFSFKNVDLPCRRPSGEKPCCLTCSEQCLLRSCF